MKVGVYIDGFNLYYGNPSPDPRAGDLRGEPTDGVGGHWWYRLSEADFTACQLPKKVGSVHRPRGW